MAAPAFTAHILVADDNESNRDLLRRRLQHDGHEVSVVADGHAALARLAATPFDLLLLDIMMPSVNGYEVLTALKEDPGLRHIPVIVISALTQMESIIRCVELGADDYLFKPFNTVMLRARVAASLEKKRLRDQEQAYLAELERERARSERLLLNVLPALVSKRLKTDPGPIADSFPDVTVLFADIVNFTPLAAALDPAQTVELLNAVFSCFDRLTAEHGLEKIKTIGDAYMVAGGLPEPRPDHAEAVAAMAIDMGEAIGDVNAGRHGPLQLRIGIHTGPVVAGVIGTSKFAYDLWGDAVNLASRMESHAPPGAIQVTEATYHRLRERFRFEARGLVDVKGMGAVPTYLLLGRLPPAFGIPSS